MSAPIQPGDAWGGGLDLPGNNDWYLQGWREGVRYGMALTAAVLAACAALGALAWYVA